jgi:mRNA-degrading endonuclease toxin of MazEF toxin-antitoxin module
MFDPGGIVMVPFPFTDQTRSKRRPVLALTAPDAQDDFIGCPITSRDRWPNARPLLAADVVDGALPLASWVRTDRIVTLNSGLIIHQIGRVSEDFRLAVASEVCRFIREVPTNGLTP